MVNSDDLLFCIRRVFSVKIYAGSKKLVNYIVTNKRTFVMQHYEYFNIVLAVYVMLYTIYHEDLLAMSQTMARMLKPGGRLLALPVHPDLNSYSKYYHPFGLRLIEDRRRADGSPASYLSATIQCQHTGQLLVTSGIEKYVISGGVQTVKCEPFNILTNSLPADLSLCVQCPHTDIIESIKDKTC